MTASAKPLDNRDNIDNSAVHAPARSIWFSANTTWYINNFCANLLVDLRERGFAVTAFSPTDEYVPHLERKGIAHVPLRLDLASTNPASELRTLLHMVTALGRARPSIVLTHTPKVNIYAGLATGLLGIPMIANVSGLGRAFVEGGWLRNVAKGLYRHAFRHPSVVFFQNDDDLGDFMRMGLTREGQAERIAGVGVDVDRFAPREGSRRDDGKVVFLLSARLLWDKGVGVFVDAARIVRARHPNAVFRLLGFVDSQNPSAVGQAQLDAWIAEGVVEYAGVTDDVRPFYADADCIVLPSYYREGVPRSLLEAASMGKPIVTTDSTGCRDTVDAGISGILCKPRDAASAAEAIERVLRMPAAERAAMGARGREKMLREFDERIVVASYATTIDRVLARRAAASGGASQRPARSS